MKETDVAAIRIGAWRVDAAREEISKDGATVKLERRAMQLLLCLAEKPGQVLSVDQLLDRVWAGVVVTPDSVYQAVASLRRILGDDSRDPTYIANVPRRGYSLVAPVAAWVEPLDAANNAQPVAAAETAPPFIGATSARRRSWWMLIALFAALMVALGYQLRDLRRPATTALVSTRPGAVADAARSAPAAVPSKSIAVLPFVDLSEDKGQQYFADGMAEEILDRLVKVPDLRVPARTSSFYFRGTKSTVADIAHQLGVANVLEGSVRKSGSRVRVIVQLVRADSGYQVWSQEYDRELRDVFQVQDEIATAVATALQISLAGGPLTRERGGTRNLEAYELYLRAQSSVTTDSSGTASISAQTMLRRAVKLDPNFGLAWTLLASMSVALVESGDLSPTEGFAEARRLATHAIELSPGVAEPHAVLAYVYRNEWNWTAAREELRLALSADPTDTVSLMLDGLMSMAQGQHDEAEHQLRAAVGHDPLFTYANLDLGNELYLHGKYGEAETLFRRLLDNSPRFRWTRPYLAKTLLAQGKAKSALDAIEPAEADSAGLDYLPILLIANGRVHDADAALQMLIEKYAATDAYYIAMTYAYRDDKQLALQWLERAFSQRDPGLLEMMGEPLLTNISTEPRFGAIVRRMNLPYSQAAS